MADAVRRCAGAALGAGLGVLVYWFARERAVHLLAAVGAGLAVGAGWFATRRSVPWGVAIAVAAPAFSLLVAWWLSPGARGSSLVQFMGQLSRNSLLSLAVVAAFGLYFGMGRPRKNVAPKPPKPGDAP